LRGKFEREINRSRNALGETFKDSETGFISLGFLENIFKTKKPNEIGKILKEDIKKLKLEGRIGEATANEIEQNIRDRYRKLYTILLMIQKSELIIKLWDNNKELLWERFRDLEVSYYREDQFSDEPTFRDVAKQLYDTQWLVPPILSSEHQNYSCASFRFPFADEPYMRGFGSWGIVYRVKIADGHLPQNSAVEVCRKEHYQTV